MRSPKTPLVVIRTTQVVAAVSAYEFAAMTDQAIGARGADLAMMVDGLLAVDGTGRTTLWDLRRKIGVESDRPLWEHARQISIMRWFARAP